MAINEIKDKIIIRNYTSLSDDKVILYIKSVIDHGKVSKSGGKYQYCFVTQFEDNIVVYCNRRNNTYTFYICKN